MGFDGGGKGGGGKGKGKGGKAKDGQDWGKLGGYGGPEKSGDPGRKGDAAKRGDGKKGGCKSDSKSGAQQPCKIPSQKCPELSREVQCTTYVSPYLFNEKAPFRPVRRAAAGDVEGRKAEQQAAVDDKAKVTQAMTEVRSLGRGSLGQPVDYLCNVLPVMFREGAVFYQYSLQGVHGDRGEIQSRGQERVALREIMAAADFMQDAPYKDVFMYVPASGRMIFTNMKLPSDEMKLVRHPRPDDTDALLQQTLSADLKLSREISSCKISQELITLFSNTFVHSLQVSQMQKIGRTYFRMRGDEIRGTGKTLYPGLYCALHPINAGHGLGLTVDVVKKCISDADAWTEIRRDPAVGQRPDIRSPATQAAMKRAWEDTVMMTVYDNAQSKKRTVHIDQVVFTESEATKQEALGGMTLKEYFASHYSELGPIPAGQPVLISVNRKRRDPKTGLPVHEKYLPSVLRLTGVATRDPKTKALREKVLRMSAVRPGERFSHLKDLMMQFFGRGTPFSELVVGRWGISLQKGFTILSGREMPRPILQMHGGYTRDTDQGSWNFDIDKRPTNPNPTPRFADVPNPPKAGLLFQVPVRAQGACQAALPTLKKALDHLAGGDVRVRPGQIPDFSASSCQAIAQGMAAARQADGFIICADQTSDEAYATVKKESIIEIGKPSQVIRESTLADQKKLKAVTNKVATQVLVKLGNSAWTIKDCSFPDTMVTGISFHHAGSAESRRQVPSVAGVVASVNSSLSRYATAECALEAGRTVASGLAGAFRLCLEQYVRANGRPPKHFVFFREGGSEGEVQNIVLEEVEAVEEAIKAAGAKPSIAYFLVLKQSHVRLVSYQPVEADPPECLLYNPTFGALVDHSIVHPMGFEFFLVSQKVDQGCATAVKYKCLKDGLGKSWTADKFQSLIFNLTCMYYNWNGPIKVPAPCLLASRHARMFGDQLRNQGTLHQIKAGSSIRTNYCIPCL